MPLSPSLLYLVGRNASSERGRVWTIDPLNWAGGYTQIKEFSEGGYTQCMGCVILDGKLWVARAYGTTDGAVSYFDGSTWTDDITWGSTGKATDIVVFNGALYVMKRISATQCEVVKRTGPGTWTNVLTITVTSTDPGGGLQVIQGSGGTEYLIAWPYTGFNASQHRFHSTTDGSSWTAASTTGLPSGWKQFSYVHWDETNSVYRLKIVGTDVDLTAATLGGAWSAGAATGHVTPGKSWGDVFTDVDGDVFTAPNADTDVRKFTAGSWSDGQALGAASQVDITSRASWIRWNGTVYLACNALDGKIITYVESTDTWDAPAGASIGSNQDFTGIAGGEHMAIQFRTNQYKDLSVLLPKLGGPISAVTRVSYSEVRGDNVTDPSGLASVLKGDTWVVATGGGSDAWVGKAAGTVMEAKIDAPSVAGDWQDHGALGTGDKVRVADSAASGGLAGEDLSIATYTGAFPAGSWAFTAPTDGLQCIQEGTTTTEWDKEIFLYNSGDAAWSSISTDVTLASGDNALEITNGELGHIDQMGHGQDTVVYVPFSDLDQSGNDPAAAGYSGKVVIANNWNTVADGHVLYSDGSTWTQLTNNALTTGARILSASAVEGGCGLTADEIQTLVATGSFGTGADWTNVTPHAGDIVFVDAPEQNPDTYAFEEATVIWDGSAWLDIAKAPSSLNGAALTTTALGQLAVDYDTDAMELVSSKLSPKYTQNAYSATNTPVDKDYVDTVAQGLDWKGAALVLKMTDDTAEAGSPPAGASQGDAWVVDTWGAGTYLGGATYADGDIGEYNGSRWIRALEQVGSEPPDGTRVIVTGAGAAGSFLNEENNMGTYDATLNQWDFEAATDGDAEMIYGDDTEYADTAWTYNGTAWVQFSKIIYTGGNGIDISGCNAISVDVAAAGGITNDYAAGGEVGIVPGDGINVDAGGITQYTYGPTWETPSAGQTHQFSAPGAGSIVESGIKIYRNGQLIKKVGAAPAIGEYTWTNATRTMLVTAQDAFDGTEEVTISSNLT